MSESALLALLQKEGATKAAVSGSANHSGSKGRVSIICFGSKKSKIKRVQTVTTKEYKTVKRAVDP